MIRSLPLLVIAAAASAVSVTDIQVPVTVPEAWIAYDQDNFALGDDDGYTAALRAGCRFDALGGPWVVTASWAIFTAKDDGLRCDEATLVVQRLGYFGPVEVTAGAGLALVGDLGGHAVQSRWHHIAGDPQIGGVYEYDQPEIRPVLAATARWEACRDVSAPSPLGQTAAALELRAGFLAHQDEARARISTAIIYEGSTDAALILEPLIELVAGDGLSFSARPGHSVIAGIEGQVHLDHLVIGVTLTTDRVYGIVGLRF